MVFRTLQEDTAHRRSVGLLQPIEGQKVFYHSQKARRSSIEYKRREGFYRPQKANRFSIDHRRPSGFLPNIEGQQVIYRQQKTKRPGSILSSIEGQEVFYRLQKTDVFYRPQKARRSSIIQRRPKILLLAIEAQEIFYRS